MPDVASSIEFHEVCLPQDEAAALEALQPFVERFRLHPLTVEDCTHRNQRCKLEAFDDYVFLVWHLYTKSREDFQEIHICMRIDSVLVVADSLPPSGGGWREYLLRGRAVSGNVKQVAVAILDRLVDDAEEYLEVLLDGVAELEKEILDRYMDPGEVLYLKRLVRQFHREMRSAQPIGGQLLDLAGHLPQVGAFSPEERLRLRNVTDHMTRLLEATQLLEAQMGALMDVYWGALGARTNKQMQRLTTLATLVLPVTFWSGLFGMNFETMPFKDAWFFVAGMVALGATWIAVLAYMFRRGVFTREHPAQRRPLFPR